MQLSASSLRPLGPGVPAILAQDLEVGYREKPVWKDASFRVERGEFVAVIGPNGAGKTTLFRMLLGLHHPARGSLEVLGAAPKRGNRSVGYVPQRHTISSDTHIAVGMFVRLGYSGTFWGPGIFERRSSPGKAHATWHLASRRQREAAEAAMEAAGALDLAEKPLGTLSGGELQRVFLAQALLGEPQILLLDEPLSNMDLRRSRELVATVQGLVQARKVTTLLVAHDINPMIHCLDRVIYIANGKVATGRPEDVLTSESLSSLYGVPVEVLRDSRGNLVIVGAEDLKGEEGG